MNWKQHPDDLKIWVSDTGQVHRRVNECHPERRQWVDRKFDVDKDGYQRCRIAGKSWYVHRLVYMLFVGDLCSDLVVCHNDGNPQNNCVTNLTQKTQKDNISDKLLHGTHQTWSKHPRAIYSDEVVKLVKEEISKAERGPSGRLKRGETLRISEKLSVNRNLVRDICAGKSWK